MLTPTVQVTPLVLELPEPPSLNVMIDMAKERTCRSRTGGRMKRALPVVYDQRKEAYELQCTAAIREAGIRPPARPWPRWSLERAQFRLWMLRDPLELLAGLKWTVDWMVHAGFVANDSTRHLLSIPIPEQVVDRAHRGVTLTILLYAGGP